MIFFLKDDTIAEAFIWAIIKDKLNAVALAPQAQIHFNTLVNWQGYALEWFKYFYPEAYPGILEKYRGEIKKGDKYRPIDKRYIKN